MELDDELMELVNDALDRLYTNESYLFQNNSSERNRVFHFARYFINILEEKKVFEDYNVDCEYNRDKFNEKKYKAIVYGGEEHRIYPDFILHKRGTNENNLLAIEFKNDRDTDRDDYYKLQALTKCDYKFRYKLGIFISFREKRNSVRIVKFINGKKVLEK